MSAATHELFKPRVLRPYLEAQNPDLLQKRWEAFQAYQAKADAIRGLKEEAYQDGFLRDLFVAALGHTLQPDEGYDLVREAKNTHDAKKADAAILADGQIVGLIELKDTRTRDFDRPRTRGGKSPVEQLFGYLVSHDRARYGILSNFETLRFYIDKSSEYVQFDLFTMGRERFALLHLLLSRESIASSLPMRLKTESEAAEREITRKLYDDYSAFRRYLFDDLRRRNPERDPRRLLRLTQKLVDRIVFILFAEDTGLLRKHTIREIREEFHRQKFTDFSLYDIYKFYFQAIAEGDDRLEIPRYDGGLFAEDPELDSLVIGDEALDMRAQKLSDYDFASDVTVDILGHIFEHSLSDLEEMNAALRGEEYDADAGKRKKEGVFYTPEWVTRYILERTLGDLCERKRAELGIDTQIDAPADPKRLKAAEKATLQNLRAYRDWLKDLKICDPACGSGAFLNQALRFLVAEHERLRHDIARFGDLTAYEEIEKEILERNLYGVDINEEACEIARLSLWLSTARPGRPLTRLSGTIRSGDSLVDDPAVSDRAFDWRGAFPEVFASGGFDVVVGNPPYVRQERLDPALKAWLKERYAVWHGSADLYVFFVERGIELLNEHGKFGFIFPNKWMRASYGRPLRRWLATQPLEEIVDFGDLPVFEEATTYPMILVLDAARRDPLFGVCEVESLDFGDLRDYVAAHGHATDRRDLDEAGWNLAPVEVQRLLRKLRESGTPLGEYVNKEIYRGVLTGLNDAFVIDRATRDRLVAEDPASAGIIKPFLAGRDIKRYETPEAEKFLIFTRRGIDIDRYPAIKRHLEQFKERLMPKPKDHKGPWPGRKAGNYQWYEIQDTIAYYEKFEKPKILYPDISQFGNFTIDFQGNYSSNTTYIIPVASKELLGILNSQLFTFVFSYLSSEIRGGFLRWIRQYMEQMPIPKSLGKILSNTQSNSDFDEYSTNSDESNEDAQAIARDVEAILQHSAALQRTRRRFADYCRHALQIQPLPRKLETPERLDFDTLLGELKKRKAPVTDPQVFAALQDFHRQMSEAAQAIALLERRIDRAVYRLYGLNEAEIKLIEEG
ncbi:Eco57I restriction-modification methylase domain-containing protein [Nitratifractor sp.]